MKKCWRRLLRVPQIARRSNQPILKEINPELSLEGLMLKLQYFGHLMWRAISLEKTLMLGKTESRRREPQKTRWLDVITNSVDMGLRNLREMVKDREAWRTAVHGVAKSQTRLSDWTTTANPNLAPAGSRHKYSMTPLLSSSSMKQSIAPLSTIRNCSGLAVQVTFLWGVASGLQIRKRWTGTLWT